MNAEVAAAEVVDGPSAEPTGPALLDALFPDGAAYRRSLESYFVLLWLAALIATFGLIEDSVAAIIGAMIVAPLGGAIMALAGALVSDAAAGSSSASSRSAWALAWSSPSGSSSPGSSRIPLGLNPSIEARTSPGLLDLGVALAAGAAGAYCLRRRAPDRCGRPAGGRDRRLARSAAGHGRDMPRPRTDR